MIEVPNLARLVDWTRKEESERVPHRRASRLNNSGWRGWRDGASAAAVEVERLRHGFGARAAGQRPACAKWRHYVNPKRIALILQGD